MSDRNLKLVFAQEDQPEMITLEEELHHLEELPHVLPALQAEPSSSSSSLSPSKEELQKWQARLSHFHKAAGHPTARNLARLVRDAGCPAWKVQTALEHQCETCKSLKLGGTSSGQIPPAATHPLPGAWECIGLDTAEWLVPGQQKKARFILIIDLATKLRAVKLIKEYPELAMQPESSEEIIEGLVHGWLAHFPKPKLIVADNAKSFVSARFHEFCEAENIQLHFPPEKEPWSHGIVEAAIADIKHVASAIQLEALDNTPALSLTLAASALNGTEFTAGYSAHQWAFGARYAISDEDIRVWNAIDPKEDFLRISKARAEAEEIARRSRAKRVMSKLTNTTVKQPLRTYSPTDLVMIWRKVQAGEQHQGSRGGHKKSGRPRWVGPGRVVFAESIPHQEVTDQRQHILWVLVGRRLWRCSVHSVRPVNEAERLQHELHGGEDPTLWKTLEDLIPRREYQDITNEEPTDRDRELPDLPPEPNATTLAPIRRAVGKSTLQPSDYKVVKTHLKPDYKSTHRSSPIGQVREAPKPQQYLPQPEIPMADYTPTEPPDPGELQERMDDVADKSEAVNDYDKPDLEVPEAKKAKLDHRTEYDLKWLEQLHAEAQQEVTHEDLFTFLQSYEGDCLHIELDLNFKNRRDRRNFQLDPVLYLTKKLNSAEVSLKALGPDDLILFTRAKAKEVNSFLKNGAVRRCLSDEEVKKAFGSGRILKARCVLTWKPIPPDEVEESIRDRETNPETVVDATISRKAKARIVLLGYQHPSLLERNFKTSAPVISTLGRHMIYLASVVHQWRLTGLDLATAFLQTMPTEADDQLYTTGVTELRQALGVPEHSCLRILRNIYGSTTAPRGLWLSLNEKLTSLGGRAIRGERCLWAWYSKHEMDPVTGNPRLLGLMGGHVDDFHQIGDENSPEWQEVVQLIDTSYNGGSKKRGSYRHAGSDVHTIEEKDGGFRIQVDQSFYVEGLADISIDPQRLREQGPLAPHEVNACRTALGALQWLAVQSQPLITARCNLLLSEITTAGTLESAREIQAIINECRAQATCLEFSRFDCESWDQVVFVGMGDQAHSNREKGGSTGGMVILASSPKCLDGAVSKMSLLAWRTWKLKRRAVGSNDAEVQSILETEDVLFRSRVLWAELHGAGKHVASTRGFDMVDAMEAVARLVRGILCTDSRGGFDAIEVSESPLLGLTNLRAALQAFQLRDNLRRTGCTLRWVASDYNLADGLTKKRPEARIGLERFLKSWLWAIAFDASFTAAKKNKRQGRTAVKKIDDFESSGQNGSKTQKPFLPVQVPWP